MWIGFGAVGDVDALPEAVARDDALPGVSHWLQPLVACGCGFCGSVESVLIFSWYSDDKNLSRGAFSFSGVGGLVVPVVWLA